jgi:CRP/FNR family transcriptional regulator
MAPADLKLETLKSLPLFADLDRKHLERLGQLTDEVDLAAGRVLWKRGDAGDEAFVIVSGNLLVERDGRVLANLGRGSIIGEMAIYAEGPRMATVTVTEPSQLLVISHGNFHTLMDEFPEVRLKVLDVLAQRVRLLDPTGSH